MAGVDLVAEADLLDRASGLVSEAFDRLRPSIGGASSVVARRSRMSSAVAQPGQHAVIYGEQESARPRSPASVKLLTGANVLTTRATVT